MKKLKAVALAVLLGVMVISTTCSTTISAEAEQQETSTEKKVTKQTKKIKKKVTKKTKKKKVKTKKVVKKKKKKTKKKKNTKKYSSSDLRLLTVIIYMEAGGDCWGSQDGKDAVGIVVMNRVRSSKFPSTMKEVLSQPGQFSTYGTERFYTFLQDYDNRTLQSKKAKTAAKRALSGSTVTTNGYNVKNYLFFSAGGGGVNIGGNRFR